MNNPSIAVVMTTYNGERFLAQQVESLLTQTLKPDTIIICDDLSSDKTVEILEQFKKSHGIQYYVNETRLGVVANFKKAVSLASSADYIALCDQDDIWLPEKLEKSFLELSSIDDGITPAMIYSDLIVIDQQNNVLNPSLTNEMGTDKYRHCLSTLLFGNFTLGCTIFMNRPMGNLFADIPVNPVFNHDAWITLIAFSFGKAQCLPEASILYRKHETNVTFAHHKKSTRLVRIKQHLKSLLGSDNFLQNQFILVKAFFQQYQGRLSPDQQHEIRHFLSLEKKSYWRKKMAFEKAFSGKWKKRF